jgi:hypothetical protein
LILYWLAFDGTAVIWLKYRSDLAVDQSTRYLRSTRTVARLLLDIDVRSMSAINLDGWQTWRTRAWMRGSV